MSDETVKFRVLCVMFESMLRTKTSAKKRSKFRKFLDQVYSSRDFFSAIRLILPSLDRERGTYGLKESTLAACLIDALGIFKDSDDGIRLVNWRKGGTKTGANAGNFALVAAEVLQRRQGMASGGLTIKEINDALDLLALKENRADKASVLSDLIKKTNVLEMKWIVMIILKDLKLGVSEKSIFHEFHPDAEDLFNVTCDLKLVCEKLKDRTQRHKRQDIEVGKAVRPQLALRVSNAPTAWKKLHGKQVVVECKFDGDRIQIHKNGAEIHFFSRSFLDHSEYGHAMASVINQNILVDRCILDGEMLVWDTSTQRFAEFGSNQEIAKAAREGLESHRQLCYVAFDILYVGDTSVIHQSLKERHDLLRKVVKPLKGRLEILVPNGGLNAHRPYGEPCWSLVAYNVEDVESFFKETIENRDEGIVLKDLGSKWEPSDRSGKWLKLKPDYIHTGSDLDVLIIGGYFGSGRHGGEVAQFLVGLAESSISSTYPKRFISFCRVGTGLSDDELDAVVAKLKPYFRKNEYPKRTPSFYEVTNNSKERPDVWVESPEKSIILSITSDIRTISSEVFAAPYSLRFPRIHRVRYDKSWHDCLDVQSFVHLVQSSNGNTQRGTDYGGLHDHKSKHVKSLRKGEEKTISVVPAHFIQTDISGIQEATLIFTNMMFYFVNVPPPYSVDSFHKMVAENGGSFSMNLNDSVTHCIAAERKGIKYQASKLHGDIIHYSWILDCCSQKHLLHLQPKYFLSLSDSSKKKLQDEIDAFSDYYYWDLDEMDIKQMFGNMDKLEDPKNTVYYKKYRPMGKWSLFQDCCISFFASTCPTNPDPKDLSELSLKRMALEVSMHGGEVSNDLSHATHLVLFSAVESDVDFDIFSESISPEQRHLLCNKKLHVVRHQWLEDSLERGKRLQEDAYSSRPKSSEELDIEKSEQDVEDPVAIDSVEQQRFSASPDRNEKRKRGRSTHINTRRGRMAVGQSRRTRGKLESRPAKIDLNDSENSVSSDEAERKEDTELVKGNMKRGANIRHTRRTRAKLGSRPPKINPNELENTASSDEAERREATKVKERNTTRAVNIGQTRRTRTKLGGRPAKLNPNESEISASSDEGGTREGTVLRKGSGGIFGTTAEVKAKYPGNVNNADKINAYKGKDILDYRRQQWSDTVGRIEMDKKESVSEGAEVKGSENICGIQEEEKKGTTGKLEQMIDPVQAMLLDMIPSLGLQKAETQKTVFENEKPQLDPSENPAKKKVSYKDVAGLLLKDW